MNSTSIQKICLRFRQILNASDSFFDLFFMSLMYAKLTEINFFGYVNNFIKHLKKA